MQTEALVDCSDLAAATLQQAFLSFSRNRDEVLALVYIAEATSRDGDRLRGFRPGYIPTVWPVSSVSDNWLVAHLPDGIEFDFLPSTGWGKGGTFAIDLLDLEHGTFTVARE